jgi:hypothetical protein
MNGAHDWQLFFVLPNLSVRRPTPFATEFIGVCSGEDERMQALTDSPADLIGARMIRAFRAWFGTPYTPSRLLIREDSPPIYRNAEVLRAFRNACAISAITNARR